MAGDLFFTFDARYFLRPLNGWNMPERDFQSIYVSFSRLVYWAAHGVLKNKEQAEDATQNVFISLLKHMDDVSEFSDAQLKGWLYRSAVNAALDLKRKTSREVLSDEPVWVNVADPSASPADEAVAGDTRAAVRLALDGLEDTQREPLMLHYFSGMSIQEIAETLEISEGTVKSRMARGRKQLAVILRAKGVQL